MIKIIDTYRAIVIAIFEFVSETKSPWIVTTQTAVTKKDVPKDLLLLELDATLMTNLESLYREFAAVFKFPDYFWKNFNALDECITDLEWLPADGYLLVIKDSCFLLKEEPDDTLKGLLSILNSAGKEWAVPVEAGEPWDREGVPFHTILELDEKDVSAFQVRLKTLDFKVENL